MSSILLNLFTFSSLLAVTVSHNDSEIFLSKMNIRLDAITLSGFSSGSSMATQFHVSHSSLFHGVALFSTGYYRCGPNSLIDFALRCSKTGLGIFPYKLESAIEDAKSYEALGLIDPLINLKNQRVFVWTGKLDEYIYPETALQNADFYKTFTKDPTLISSTLFYATHLFPTTNFGDGCDKDAEKNVYLGNCGYSGAFQALEFLLRDKATLINPFISNAKYSRSIRKENEGQLFAYNQSEFYKGGNITNVAMGTQGFIYIPKQCRQKSCFLHLNFHGCNEYQKELALIYIRNNGFLQVADLNDIIIVFPLSTKTPHNMGGCWDFFSYTGSLFATKQGEQIKVARAILDRILYGK